MFGVLEDSIFDVDIVVFWGVGVVVDICKFFLGSFRVVGIDKKELKGESVLYGVVLFFLWDVRNIFFFNFVGFGVRYWGLLFMSWRFRVIVI